MWSKAVNKYNLNHKPLHTDVASISVWFHYHEDVDLEMNAVTSRTVKKDAIL